MVWGPQWAWNPPGPEVPSKQREARPAAWFALDFPRKAWDSWASSRCGRMQSLPGLILGGYRSRNPLIGDLRSLGQTWHSLQVGEQPGKGGDGVGWQLLPWASWERALGLCLLLEQKGVLGCEGWLCSQCGKGGELTNLQPISLRGEGQGSWPGFTETRAWLPLGAVC